MTDAPIVDIDPFSDEFRRDPEPAGERLQEAGPVVYLKSHGIYGMARYAEVHAVLRDHESFCSSGGAGSLTRYRPRSSSRIACSTWDHGMVGTAAQAGRSGRCS